MRVGIDLGTTYSLAARVDSQGTPALFPDHRDAERFRTPSVVHIGPGGAFVGQSVEELLEESPGLEVVRFVKDRMGLAQSVVTDHLGRGWEPEAVAALILLKLRRDIRAHTEEPIDGAVIGVPAHFCDGQRRATRRAAEMAGFGSIELIEEPLAAAVHYGAYAAGAAGTAMVCDLGGGTFDATAVAYGPDGLSALATHGVPDLGGRDIDAAVMGVIAEQFRLAHRYDPLADPVAEGPLRRHAEAIKVKLTTGRREVRTSLLLGGRALEVVVTRASFDRLVAPLVERMVAACQTTLKAAGLDWGGLDRVLLAGGGALVPAVEEGVRRAAGPAASRVQRHQPHTAVAYGAALLAAHQAGASAPPIRQRVTGADVGFRVLDSVTGELDVDVVIGKNTPAPARRTRSYAPNRPSQSRVVFEVVQVKEPGGPAHSLGTFAFPLQRGEGRRLDLTVACDEQGLVTVVARDPATGREVSREYGDGTRTVEEATRAQQRMVADIHLCD